MSFTQNTRSIRAFLLHINILVLCLPVAYLHICSNASICETNFERFTDLQLPGCGQTVTSRQTSLACARSCFSNQNCTAFTINGTICKTCPGGLVTGVMFVPGQNTFLQRTMMVTNFDDSGYVDKVLPIPGGISSGRVGYLHATLKANNSFNIDFGQDSAVTTSNFHLRARWDSNSDRKLVLNHCKNGTWGSPEVFPPFPFPFTIDMPFTLHVLVAPKSFDVYINGTYCCYYNHTLAVGDVRYMRVSGAVNVHEMSI